MKESVYMLRGLSRESFNGMIVEVVGDLQKLGRVAVNILSMGEHLGKKISIKHENLVAISEVIDERRQSIIHVLDNDWRKNQEPDYCDDWIPDDIIDNFSTSISTYLSLSDFIDPYDSDHVKVFEKIIQHEFWTHDGDKDASKSALFEAMRKFSLHLMDKCIPVVANESCASNMAMCVALYKNKKLQPILSEYFDNILCSPVPIEKRPDTFRFNKTARSMMFYAIDLKVCDLIPHFRRAYMLDLVDLHMYGGWMNFLNEMGSNEFTEIDEQLEQRVAEIRRCRKMRWNRMVHGLPTPPGKQDPFMALVRSAKDPGKMESLDSEEDVRGDNNTKCTYDQCSALRRDFPNGEFPFSCQRCHRVQYCSQFCHKADFKWHHLLCHVVGPLPAKPREMEPKPEVSDSKQTKCSNCGRISFGKKWHMCEKCKSRFCDKVCLEYAWRKGNHKSECRKIRKRKKMHTKI